jgi:hypothetical protein
MQDVESMLLMYIHNQPELWQHTKNTPGAILISTNEFSSIEKKIYDDPIFDEWKDNITSEIKKLKGFAYPKKSNGAKTYVKIAASEEDKQTFNNNQPNIQFYANTQYMNTRFKQKWIHHVHSVKDQPRWLASINHKDMVITIGAKVLNQYTEHIDREATWKQEQLKGVYEVLKKSIPVQDTSDIYNKSNYQYLFGHEWLLPLEIQKNNPERFVIKEMLPYTDQKLYATNE